MVIDSIYGGYVSQIINSDHSSNKNGNNNKKWERKTRSKRKKEVVFAWRVWLDRTRRTFRVNRSCCFVGMERASHIYIILNPQTKKPSIKF
jgi:hypothetical protein